MKSENKSDSHLVVGSLEVLQEITGSTIRTIQTSIKETAQSAKTLGSDFRDFYTQMTFDCFISPAEKKILKKEHDQIILDYPLVCAHAIEIGIIESDSRFIAYKTAYETLYTYLYTTIQVFDEMEKETTIAQRSDFIDIWNAYYAALTTIQINVNNEIINGYSSGTQVEAPDYLTLSSAIAEQHKIVVTANLLTQGLKNSLKKVIFYIQKTVGGVWEEYENESYVFEYFFDRATDGYPEAGTVLAKDLGNWRIKAKAVNIYGKVSADYGNEILVNTDSYGTWNVLPPDVISAQSATRAANVTWQKKDISLSGKPIYGITFFDIQISKDGTNWFKPAQGKTGKVSEDDWKDGTGYLRLSGGGWSQSLPLYNQTINLPENTPYYYRVRTRGITDTYVSAWSDPVTAIALATGIGDIIAKTVKEAQLDDSSVSNIKIQDNTIVASDKVVSNTITTELLNVLAKNKINNFSITGTLEGWTTSGTLEDDASGFKKLRFTNSGFLSNLFTVQPNEICSFEFGIACPNYTSLSGAFIGLTLGQSFKNYQWSFITNKWTVGTVSTYYNYFILDYKATTVKYFKTYILGSNVSINDIPAPSATDATHVIFAIQLQGTDTTARIRTGFNPITAGTYWELYLPQVYSGQGGKIVAQQIITPSLSAINVNAGEITSGILRAIIKAGESKPNVFLDLDTEEFRVGNEPSLEDSNHEDAEYLHWKPNVGLFLKLKNLIVDALASTIRGRFRIRGTIATMAQSVLIVNPESTADPDTNTPANTTDIKTALRCPAGITGNLTGNATTATLATQANAIKPLGNSITLPATPTSVTKIIKIATVNWIYAGTINIRSAGNAIEDGVKIYINGASSTASGVRVVYGKNNILYGIKKTVVTSDTSTYNSNRQIYAEIVTVPTAPSTTILGVVETNNGTITPSMTEVSSVEGTIIDSLELNYLRGDISSYQHVFTKNIIGNVTGDVTGNVTGNVNGNVTGNLTGNVTGNVTGNLTGNADTASNANVRVALRHGTTWSSKTWTGLTNFYGSDVWTDGENIYLSNGTTNYVLNKATNSWSVKTWTGLTNFNGGDVWTDGDNIYYSSEAAQYVLNKATNSWSVKTWTGLTNFNGSHVWTDGENIYYSYGTTNYVLNKATNSWSVKTWSGLTDFYGRRVWTDGDNIYYSYQAANYVLNKATNSWSVKTWTGLTNFNGSHVWTDGENIYLTNGTTNYVLNKATNSWSVKTWSGLTDFNGYLIWTDGENIYGSSAAAQYVLPATRHNYVDNTKYNSLFGTVTYCKCNTLSARFVFRNE